MSADRCCCGKSIVHGDAISNEMFQGIYRKVDRETDIALNTDDVDEIVGRLIGETADYVCSRYITIMVDDVEFLP